jgi:hypothetical protein
VLAVDVEPRHDTVVRGGDVMPFVQRHADARVEVVRHTTVERQADVLRLVIDPEHRPAVVAARPRADDRDVAGRSRLADPR